MAASAGLFDAVRSVLRTGRFFDSGHDARADKVLVLGKNAAKRLGINRVDSQPAVFIGDQAYTVIGLRRALGAARRHVAGQFLVESVIVGFLGGLLGTAVGVSLLRYWTPILDNKLTFGAPLLGALIGLIAGTYPAWKAAAIQPITALRGGA